MRKGASGRVRKQETEKDGGRKDGEKKLEAAEWGKRT